MSKRRYGGEQTKKDIVAKAKILFSQKGYTATSMNDICNATGRSIGNIYYHFKSKEDLFIFMSEQVLTEWLEQWEEISSQYQSITEKLYAFADYYVDTNYDRSLIKAGEELISKVGADSEIGKKLFAIFTNLFRSFENLMLEGITKGEFKNENPKVLSLIILSYHIGLMGNYYYIDQETMKTLCRKATTLFIEGLSNCT